MTQITKKKVSRKVPGKGGRPPGRKNNATLMKEGEMARALKLCDGHAALEAPAIVIAMAKRAKEGDVQAAKLILDRVYPARRQVDDRGTGIQGITINIQAADTEGQTDGIDQEQGTPEQREPDPASRQERYIKDGVEILAFPGSQEGDR